MQFNTNTTPLPYARLILCAIVSMSFVFTACSDDAVNPVNTDSALTQTDNDNTQIDNVENGKSFGNDQILVDTYANFAALKAAESGNYTIGWREKRSRKIVIAIHGGGIEPGTSELASDLAGNKYNYYDFSGTLSSGNSRLHITSTNFDEPKCLDMVGDATICLSLHGFNSSVKRVYVGGRDIARRDAIYESLIDYGFPAIKGGPAHLAGTSLNNICNKTTSNKGVQLEISRALRESMFDDFSPAADRATSKNFTYLKFLVAVNEAF